VIVVDRIINGIAVCIKEDDSIEIPLSSITGAVKEGSVLRACVSSDQYFVDTEKTESRRESMVSRFDRLKKRNR